ncbi:polyadenylation and cleavage factor homolog 4-like isoform X1 [Cynara cardunculus var. scolymus]|uniref:CID domain-containing protein n=2 Tax=Cynara cardunculus var. scolymus TaxID=59895 RepID=A0A103XV16_CYNCS|nr:polyadenylation and cleavage factor homolog 4-like isoform X1 [Cynara cardunculus var. scolymus]XP_024988432.1 polyadenylation and cleavage factor homolog 4-like isoform X1 [Cynara cardunculus var. scolymus]KVH97398.1 CID domain-containing protein [Cynara cardunculus var. scolymus]
MEGASFLSSRSIGYRPAPNDSVAALASNNNQKSLTPILDRFKVLLKQREEEIRVSSGGDDDIESPVLSTEEIVELYEDVLSELIINSKPIITDLTIIAGEQRGHGAGIADAICARIIEVPVEQKLPSLYLLDSIVKNIGREYVRHFSARLPEVYCAAYRQVHPSLHPSMRHLFGTWATVFPSSVLRKIETQLQFSPPSSYQSSGLKDSESPRPAHGIHVNPKYLEARRQLESSTADSKIQHARANSAPKILGQPCTGFDEYESDNGEQSLGSTSHIARPLFGLSHARPPSPALEEFAIADSPRRVVEGASPSYHGYGYRPGGVTAGDDEPRDWRRSHLSGASRQLEASTTHSVSNGFDIQRPRDLINAYGTDERNKTTNQKLQHVKNLTINGLGSKVGGQTWQNAEEEEFEWEDMSPTLADRGRGGDLFSLPGSSKAGHARGANRSIPTKTDFGRRDWSSQELLPSVAPNNRVSLPERGLKRKIAGFQNEASDIPVPHYPQESSNLSHDQPWGAQHHYNPHGRRPPPLIDSFLGANPQHHLSSLPRLNSSSHGMMNPEASIPASKGAWRPQVNIQKSQPLPVLPSLSFQKHGRSQFDTLNASNSAVNDNSSFLHQQQFDTSESRLSSQLPQLPNQQAGFAPHQQIPGQNTRFSSQDLRNMVSTTLGFNPSHLASRPMIRGYTPQRFDGSGGASLNPVPGMQSSMPFHLHGVGVPPLPPGPPPIPQLPLSIGPTQPGGGALSGLFSSLVAQGLLSLTKTPEQDSVGLEFDPDVLKTRHESAIIALYADLPRQCKTCGRRFKLQEEHSSHMDWHVTKNRVSKSRKQKPSQKWFANVSLWLSSAEALGTDPVPGFLNQSENVVEKKDDEDMAVPADEDQNVCALCGEPFDDFYSDETEEWMYRGAVYMNAPSELTVGMDRSRLGPIVHAKCRSESTVAPPDDSGNNERVFNEDRMRS